MTRSDSTTIHTGDARHHNIYARLNRGSYLIAGRVERWGEPNHTASDEVRTSVQSGVDIVVTSVSGVYCSGVGTSQCVPSDDQKVKTLVGGFLYAYELPETGLGEEERLSLGSMRSQREAQTFTAIQRASHPRNSQQTGNVNTWKTLVGNDSGLNDTQPSSGKKTNDVDHGPPLSQCQTGSVEVRWHPSFCMPASFLCFKNQSNVFPLLFVLTTPSRGVLILNILRAAWKKYRTQQDTISAVGILRTLITSTNLSYQRRLTVQGNGSTGQEQLMSRFCPSGTAGAVINYLYVCCDIDRPLGDQIVGGVPDRAWPVDFDIPMCVRWFCVVLPRSPSQQANGTSPPSATIMPNLAHATLVDEMTSSGQFRQSSGNSSASSSSIAGLSDLDNSSTPHGFIVALHRKMIRQDVYFMSSQKTKPSLFGLPVIVPCNDSTTHQDLYQSIWVQVTRLVSPLPPSESAAPNHAQDWSKIVLTLSLPTITLPPTVTHVAGTITTPPTTTHAVGTSTLPPRLGTSSGYTEGTDTHHLCIGWADEPWDNKEQGYCCTTCVESPVEIHYCPGLTCNGKDGREIICEVS
uniref:(California timema) hypothetical protein n=1 Tax=Timema californicum TaxID=61474 RepID=A0A7R9J1D3_TIMCA|nr:unnamed protein product [Timema californicum]